MAHLWFLLLLPLLFCAVPVESKATKDHDDAPLERRDRRTTGPSVLGTKSKARRAAQTPVRVRVGSNHWTGGSHRMEDYSLAHCAQSLKDANPCTSFEHLLRLEEEEHRRAQIESSRTPPSLSISPMVVGSSFLLMAVTLWWDPSGWSSAAAAVGPTMGNLLAVAWIPWCWYHPTKLALVDMLLFLQAARVLNPMLSFQTSTHQVVTTLWKTVEKIIMKEIWTRTWKWVFDNGEEIYMAIRTRFCNFDTVDPGEPPEMDREWRKDGHLVWSNEEPPSWLVRLHVSVVGSVRKVIKSAFENTIQDTVMSALEVWKTALQEQIITALEKN